MESRDAREMSVLTDAPVGAGQQLRLDLFGSESRATLQVQVAESTAVIAGGSVRYRVKLGIVD